VANLGRDAHPILISEDIRHRKTAISVQVAPLAPLRNSGQTLHVAPQDGADPRPCVISQARWSVLKDSKTMDDLLLHGLEDVYNAENHISEAD
jgi:hypothetical protein